MEKMKMHTGKILWWNDEHMSGALIDQQGNEYLFNSASVSLMMIEKGIKKDQNVTFWKDMNAYNCQCAHLIEHKKE